MFDVVSIFRLGIQISPTVEMGKIGWIRKIEESIEIVRYSESLRFQIFHPVLCLATIWVPLPSSSENFDVGASIEDPESVPLLEKNFVIPQVRDSFLEIFNFHFFGGMKC